MDCTTIFFSFCGSILSTFCDADSAQRVVYFSKNKSNASNNNNDNNNNNNNDDDDDKLS